MIRTLPQLALLGIVTLSAGSVFAQGTQIVGTWNLSMAAGQSIGGGNTNAEFIPQNGPILFGNLPLAGEVVLETATLQVTGWTPGLLPLPTYASDGSIAAVNEVFWSAIFRFGTLLPAQSNDLYETLSLSYSGGSMAVLGTGPPPTASCLFPQLFGTFFCSTGSVDITAVAIRTGPSPTGAPENGRQMSFGNIKAGYR